MKVPGWLRKVAGCLLGRAIDRLDRHLSEPPAPPKVPKIPIVDRDAATPASSPRAKRRGL